jgi:hypothetical protein
VTTGLEFRLGFRLGFGVWVLGFVLTASGCAARLISLPSDPGTPLPDFAAIHRQASAACTGVRTLTAELSLGGRAGGRALRGRAIVGFERPASIRLEAVAPFGAPGFILAGSGASATLLLPRDNRVLENARAEDILGALTGVALSPADLLAVLTGCVVAMPMPSGGRMHENGWVSIDLSGGATVYLARVALGWQPRAARRPGWQIEYPLWQTGFPASVRLRSLDAAVNVDMTAVVSQLEANVPIEPVAFKVTVSPGLLPMTLDELRNSGPLREP